MGPFRSLSARITLSLTIGLTGVLLISGGVARKNINDEIHRAISRAKESAISLQADNASVPLWNLDRDQLQILVNNIVKDRDTVFASIKNYSDGNVVVTSGQLPDKQASDFSILTHPITYQSSGRLEELGALSVAIDYSHVSDQVSIIMQEIAVVAGSMLIFVILVIYAITWHMVRPVRKLSDQLLSVAQNEGVKISIQHISSNVIEVEQLFKALNRMQSAQVVYEEKLIKAKNEAESSSLAKSEFLANMSHELRTPLNSIIGITRMLRDDAPMDSEEREMTSIVFKSGVNLLGIVNDILDLSKIESNKMEFESKAFDLKLVIYNIVETLAPMASKRGVSLCSHFDRIAQLPFIVGDPLRVTRIVMNLVGNAIKYTEQGDVDVRVGHRRMGNNQVEIKIDVVDSGVGIPEDRLEAIFQKFTQADATTTRRFGGTGLGLTITKDLVELMGGAISVQSKENEGSTFTVTIPFEISETIDDDMDGGNLDEFGGIELIDRIHAEDAKILVAEDHALNQTLIKKLLGRMGFTHYDVYENGRLAVKAFKERHYDMILMDCHMPVMNGYEAMESVRAAEKGTGTHIPIVALTADAMVGTRDKCYEAGADSYVSKPIDADDFDILLGRWFILPSEGIDEMKKVRPGTVVNLTNLNDFADTQEEMVAFCTQLCQSTEEDLKRLNVYCVEGVSQEWVEAVHKIKGTAGIAGAPRLLQLAREAQRLEDSTAERRRNYFDNLCIAYQEVKDVLHTEGLLNL